MNTQEEKLLKYVSKYPRYMMGYYYNLQSFQSFRTKDTYIKGVCSMLDYFVNEGIDINNTNNFDIDNINMYFYSIRYTTRGGTETMTSVAYRKTKWSALNNFFKYMVSTGKMESNPLGENGVKREHGRDHVKRVYMEKSDISHTLYQLSKSKSRFSERDMAIIFTFLQTGIRLSALSRLNVSDIKFQTSDAADPSIDNIEGAIIVAIDKGNKIDDYLLSKTAATILYKWLAKRQLYLDINKLNSEAVFINRDFDRLSIWGIEEVVKKYCPAVDGKQITPHKLRATFATHLLNETKDIELVRERMHHESIETTKLYLVRNKQDKIKAMNVIDRICFE